MTIRSKLKKSKYIFALAALSVALSSCGGKSQATSPMAAMMGQAVPVRAVSAVEKDVPLQIAAVGNVEAMSTVDVKSRVAGQILRVAFAEGQNVEKGQLLFEIDPEPLNRQIAETKANLAKDAALEQQYRANVAKDEANLKQTKASADRGLQLSKEGIFSKEQTEQVVATNAGAEASLAADQAAVESAIAATKADQAKLAQTQLQLEYTSIRAPITGRAGAVSAKAGNLVKENDTALVTILQVSPIYVSFGVPEQLLPDVRKYNMAQPLTVDVMNNDQTIASGRLEFIDNTVDTTTGAVKMKAQFPNKGNELWPGQFVNVQAQLNLERQRVTVPSSTIENGPQGKYVWLLNKGAGTVAMRPVNVLRLFKSGQGVEEAVIGSGLSSGDSVIYEGQMKLMPGAKVTVMGAQSMAQSPSETRIQAGAN